jgi:PEGA domain
MSALSKRSALLAALILLTWVGTADAQWRRGPVVIRPGFVHTPFFYDPFWAPYYSYYPYAAYPYAAPETAVRVEVKPKQAEVYVDGYYAGIADDLGGIFKNLRTTPGGHEISIRLAGYKTVNQSIYVAPGSTLKLKLTLDKLAPGESSDNPH